MKHPIMLVCALVATVSLSTLAEDAAATAAAKPAATEKAKGSKHTPAQREAAINKKLEQIKAKDEALYKELVALREKDPAAFNAKLHELNKAAKPAKQAKAAK